MAEEIIFPSKDEPLRRDVGTLGAILGQVLVQEGGHALFGRVESARLLARRRRQGDQSAEVGLRAELWGLDADVATDVVRAFAAYFGLTNLAERIHRVRRRREHALTPERPQPGGLLDVIARLREAGTDEETLWNALENLSVELVLTAHPTQATRRTLLLKEQRMAEALEQSMVPELLSPRQRRDIERRIRREVTLAWQTDEHLAARPAVADEVEYVAFYLGESIYRVLPAFYEDLGDALATVYGDAAGERWARRPAIVLRFASWVGGDMDGNPNVDAETIRATFRRQRELILRNYRSELRALTGQLSQSARRVPTTVEFARRLAELEAELPEVASRIPARYADMHYRRYCWLLESKILRTEREEPRAYTEAAEFLADLERLADSVSAHAGPLGGSDLVRDLLLRARTFGFHLATLDVRQDSAVHREVVAELLGRTDFPDRVADERLAMLRDALAGRDDAASGQGRVLPDAVDDANGAGRFPGGGGSGGGNDAGSAGRLAELARKSLAVFQAIGEARRTLGPEAVGPYIISMARGADDVLAVLFLAVRAGLVEGGRVPLDVAPLFETVDDLDRSSHTMRAMLADPGYRAHLKARRDRQVVMLGYSDSSKDSGVGASRWALQEAQVGLLDACGESGVDLILFHGRGGTVSRGGSKPREAILAEPRGTVRGRLRVTEQGEIIHLKYGLSDIALRTFELTIGAVLQATLALTGTEPDGPWREAARRLAGVSRETFRALVQEDPRFAGYFMGATPIDVIQRMRIGSRPAKRRAQSGIEDLRAIPWVFSWVQSRHLFSGWYGLGAGLEAATEFLGLAEARRMTREWPFFANLIADAEMVLSKADMSIASLYADLAPPETRGVFSEIRAEYERTRAAILTLRECDELLDLEPALQRAIRLRNPYVDPMSFVQVDLLRRWRETGRQDEALERALVSTVIGIARGLHNTG